MAFRLPSRLTFALALAAIALAPAVAVLGGQLGPSASRTLADQPGCTNTGHKGSPSLQCAPGVVTGGFGTPDEQQLTEQNSHRLH